MTEKRPTEYHPTVPAQQEPQQTADARLSAVFERAVRAKLPQTVQELVWLHADLRMADVPEKARLVWTSTDVDARWEVDRSDARPV